jgi:3-hydroxyisobutyrate dehydrogenase
MSEQERTAGTIRVGMIGLGNMGLPMAFSIARKGLAVTGYDLSAERRAQAPNAVTSLAAMLARVDVAVLSLPSSREVEAVMEGPDGILAHGRKGLIVIDTTTADPRSTRRLHPLAKERGIALVDAPVSGGVIGATNATLLVMIGGETDAIECAWPILELIGDKLVRCGGPGAGHVVKLINNFCGAANLVLAGEAMRYADANGIAPEILVEALNKGTGGSTVTARHVPNWVLPGTYDSGFTMGLMRKDVRLTGEVAQALAAQGPLSSTVAKLWRDSIEELDDDTDFTRMVALARGQM